METRDLQTSHPGLFSKIKGDEIRIKSGIFTCPAGGYMVVSDQSGGLQIAFLKSDGTYNVKVDGVLWPSLKEAQNMAACYAFGPNSRHDFTLADREVKDIPASGWIEPLDLEE